MKVKLTKDVYEDVHNNIKFYYYVPLIDIFLSSNHKIGKAVTCYIDTGATINLFSWKYAIEWLGFSESALLRGRKVPILGVGGVENIAYGHKCTIHHPEFRLENVFVYFLREQPVPLLGRIDFMDRFRKIIFDEENKELELIK